MQTGQTRMAVAAVLLLAVSAVRAPGQLRVARREWPVLLAFGLVAIAALQVLFAVAVARIPVGIALLLQYTAPVLVAVWARWIGGVRLPRAAWAGLGTVLVGVVLISEAWRKVSLDAVGVLAALGTAAALASRFLLSGHGLRCRDPLALTALGTAVGTLGLGALAPPADFPLAALAAPAVLGPLTVPIWAVVAWLGLIGTLAAYLAGVAAARLAHPTTVSQVATLEVAVGAGAAYLLLGETLSPVQLAGLGLVLLALPFAQRAAARVRVAVERG